MGIESITEWNIGIYEQMEIPRNRSYRSRRIKRGLKL